VRALVEESRDFDMLRQQEGWRKLAARIEDKRESWMTAFARRLMAGEKIDPEQLAYMRGYFSGAEFVVKHPDVAYASLERSARLAWAMALEQIEQKGYDSPYIDEREDHV
jgi:hypothetical protein